MLNMLPTDAFLGEEVVMGSGLEPVCILSKHCRDMKQQETRLRLVTLLLLMGCSALYIFTVCTDPRRGEGTPEHHGTREQRAASPQEGLCTPGGTEDKPSAAGFYIYLKSVPEDNRDVNLPIKLRRFFALGIGYNEEERAVTISQSGVYFLYMSVSLVCHNIGGTSSFKAFQMRLSYPGNPNHTMVWDGFTCPPQESRSVFMGELFELDQGDQVKVFVESGYEQINNLSFGGYLVSTVFTN